MEIEMKQIFAILLCAAALFTTGCASTASVQKLTDDECLIVLRAGTTRENPGAKSGMRYSFHVSEIDQRFNIPNTADRFIAFKIYNDNTKIDQLMGRLESGWSGSPVNVDMDIQLPYEAGKVIPLNFSMINEIKKVGANSYSGGIEFYKLNKEEINALYSEIKTNPDYASWF